MDEQHRGRSRSQNVVPVRKRRSLSLPSHPTQENLPLQPNWSKLQQVLDYSRSVDKISKVIGVDMETVRDIQKEKLEHELFVDRSLDTAHRARASSKALEILGHDPSAEKVKKTLGLDEDEMERARLAKLELDEYRLMRKRTLATPFNKKQASKAFSTLGYDPSVYRSMKLLGLKEDSIQLAITEENIRLEKRIMHSRKHLASRNRKDNKKALNTIGHDPSKEKVIHQLGEEAAPEIEAHFAAQGRLQGQGQKRKNQYPFLASKSRTTKYRCSQKRAVLFVSLILLAIGLLFALVPREAYTHAAL